MDRNPMQQVYDRLCAIDRTALPSLDTSWDMPRDPEKGEWHLDVIVGKGSPSAIHLVIQWNPKTNRLGGSCISGEECPFEWEPEHIHSDVDVCVAWVLNHAQAAAQTSSNFQ